MLTGTRGEGRVEINGWRATAGSLSIEATEVIQWRGKKEVKTHSKEPGHICALILSGHVPLLT